MNLVEKMVETRLMWFEHVERGFLNSIVRKVYHMEGSQIRGKNNSKKLRETIRNGIKINESKKKVMFDRTLWRCSIHLNESYLNEIRLDCFVMTKEVVPYIRKV
jgi:hypothetical protein